MDSLNAEYAPDALTDSEEMTLDFEVAKNKVDSGRLTNIVRGLAQKAFGPRNSDNLAEQAAGEYELTQKILARIDNYESKMISSTDGISTPYGVNRTNSRIDKKIQKERRTIQGIENGYLGLDDFDSNGNIRVKPFTGKI